VHSIERFRAPGRTGRVTSAGAVALLVAACSTSLDRAPGEAGDVGRRAPPAATAGDSRQALPPPRGVRNWTEVRQQAAERIVAANPGTTYTGGVPDPLLAIPVLEIELNADGSIRRIEVLREPRQAKETLQIAVDAVRRAAPFGDVSRLPRPWKFVETFLFDDSRKFKPRTLEH
jgi:hypothetical protein